MRFGNEWRRFGYATYETFAVDHEKSARFDLRLLRTLRALFVATQIAVFFAATGVGVAVIVKAVDAALDRIHY